MYIGDIIKNYRTEQHMTLEDFAEAANLTVDELQILESNVTSQGNTPVPVSIRQIKGLSQAMNIPMPVLMGQIPSDQQVVVQVVAESDQPHAK